MRLLITGASGYVGGNIARRLADLDHSIIAPARQPAHVPSHSKIEPVGCDLAVDLHSVPNDYDAIVHIAAHAPPRKDSTAAHLAHNLVALQKLVRHAAQKPGRKFIFLSSISVYGQIASPVVDESTPVVDPGSYGLSKRLGELLLKEQSNLLPTYVLRLPGLIGPAAPTNGVWLARVRESIRKNEIVTIHSPDKPFNNVVHLDDLSAFVESLLLLPTLSAFEVLTLSSAEPLPIGHVVETLANAMGQSVRWVAEPSHRPCFTISHRKAAAEHSYAPMTVAAALRQFARE